MKFFILCLLVVVTRAVPLEEWDLFKASYGKNYKTEVEEQERLGIFFRNKHMIKDHNKKYENGLVSFHIKMNRFGDMTNEEVKETLMKQSKNNPSARNGEMFIKSARMNEMPNEVDWRVKGAVSLVENQYDCSSSWAFSAIGSLEGQLFKKANKLVPLSVQNLVDCSKAYGNNGCNGGMTPYAFNYIKDNGGVDSGDSYPYEGQDGPCRFRRTYVAGEDVGYSNIPRGDEDALQEAVATVGPISAVVDASRSTFIHYSEGIYYSKNCQSEKAAHSVLVVGYGEENGQEYWLVKNSWGINWGESGYIKMARNKNNNCGIASLASYPLV